LGFIG
jgi:hypothetical protein